jgi:hypothetical protein
MDPDPLTVIAESYRSIAQSTAAIAQTQRLALWIQAFVCVLLGVSLLFLALVVWQHGRHSVEMATLTQALTVQTQALRDQLRNP